MRAGLRRLARAALVVAAVGPVLLRGVPLNGARISTDEGQRSNFSFAGYETGIAVLPQARVFRHLEPVDGDSTARLQGAVDELAKLPLDGEGYRGTIDLADGVFRVRRPIAIAADGIIISGVSPKKGLTRIVRVGRSSGPVFRVGDPPGIDHADPTSMGSPDSAHGSFSRFRAEILGDHVDEDGRRILVDRVESLREGEMVEIIHPATDAWLSTIDNGGTGPLPSWGRGSVTVHYFRQIVRLEPPHAWLDAPVFDSLDRRLSRSILRPDRSRIRHVGLRNLQIVIRSPAHPTDVAASAGVRFSAVKDCWAENVRVLGFDFAGIETTDGTSRCTLLHCTAEAPGQKGRHAFWLAGAQLILFRQCEVNAVENGFTSAGGPADSGNVFVNCMAGERVAVAARSIGHWAHAFLFDGLTATAVGTRLSLNNAEQTPELAGWSMAGSVAWNCTLNRGALLLGGPSVFANRAFGCQGWVAERSSGGSMGEEIVAGAATPRVAPPCLYDAQLAFRLRAAWGGRRPGASSGN